MKVQSSSSSVLQQLQQLGDADDFRALSRTLNLYVLHSRSANVTALINIMKNAPFVQYVEPDYIVKTIATPNDPNFSQQWSFLNTGSPGADISATSAWNISTGSTANVAGVIDTGVDYTHSDLAGNIWSAPAQFAATLSWGTITCPAGSHGYNAVMRSCNPADDNGHGTHVSGTIGAIGNNAAGVAGVNWTTRIMGLKFLDSSGSGATSDAIDVMEFAVQAKAQFAATGTPVNVRVFSASWGGSGFSQALLDEINKANSSDVLFVAAAGNNGSNNDTSAFYPAAYNAQNLIAVAATTNTDSLASFSNYGKATVHLAAPGVNILSTVPGNSYGFLSGTSMATPHVSGTAMLVLSRCSLNTAALKNTLLANVDPIAALAGLTVTGGRLNAYKALNSCAGGGATTGTASFVKTDTTTQGNWKGTYGADGYNVINDTVRYPTYVGVTPSGNSSYTWTSSTADMRAMQKASASDRIASCWFTPASFTIDLNFTDSNTHQVALYMLDWDGWNGPRSERIDILDAGNNVLDTRSISSFGNGMYLVWNLSGHVIVRFTNTNLASNAIVNGILFGGGGGTSSSGSASFLKTDTTTQGTWKGVYGNDGYNIINDSASYPAYVTVTPSANASYTWTTSTTDRRALQKGSASDRIAACWYSSGSFTIDLAFNDSNPHQVALYMLDWDGWNGPRSERIDVLDSSNNVLDSRSIASFGNGMYLVWNLSGHVIVRITNTNPLSNAIVNGLLFGAGGSGSAASFLKTDITTQGTWKGVYGADGYNVINNSSSYPAYASVAPSGTASFIWTTSTIDPRGLQTSSANDRIAACWYSPTVFTLDLNLTDSNTHQLALYMLDWDGWNGPRSERIDILDTSNNVLDTRSISSFGGGMYLVWNLKGHVVIRVTNTNLNSNALISGIFFK